MDQQEKNGKQSATRGASTRNSQSDADNDDLTNHPCTFCGEYLTYEEVNDEETFCRWCRAKNLDRIFGPGI